VSCAFIWTSLLPGVWLPLAKTHSYINLGWRLGDINQYYMTYIAVDSRPRIALSKAIVHWNLSPVFSLERNRNVKMVWSASKNGIMCHQSAFHLVGEDRSFLPPPNYWRGCCQVHIICKYLDIPPSNTMYSNIDRMHLKNWGAFSTPLSTPLHYLPL